MSNNKCLDILLIISMASFVSITLPISSIVISDYTSTRNYVEGICNGTTLSNYSTFGGFFFHGRVNVTANVNGTLYYGYLYYPPIKHWQLGAMTIESVDEWYYSLNKTTLFSCFVDLTNPSHPMVNEWIQVIGYYIMFIMCIFIITASTCVLHNSRKRRDYISIPDELPPPYTPIDNNKHINRPKSLYKSLNEELTTISL